MYEKWLKAFHMVASQGGFTRAARALNVGQPTVSTHVKTLEDYFHVELLHRRGRAVELTATGRALFEITEGLYGHEAEAISFLRTVGRNERGRLRIGAVGPYDVIEIADAFRTRHPRIDLEVSVARRDEILGALRRFELDAGVLAEEPTGNDLFTLLYDRHPIVVIVPRTHRLARRRSIAIGDLAGEPMILRDPSSSTRRGFERALEAAGVNVRPIMEINSREAVREAVARGMGLGVFSEREFAPHPAIRVLRVRDVEMHTAAWLVCLTMRRGRALIDAFVRVVRETRPRP